LLNRIADILEVDATDLLISETVNVYDNDVHDNPNGGVINGDVNNSYSFPPELKRVYEGMMQLMRELVEEKNRTITANEKIIELLQKLKGK